MANHDQYNASPGAWELLSEKSKLLDAVDRARSQVKNRDVQTEHGNVAEAELRKWLRRFLPSRYGVCRGFIIKSWSGDDTDKLHHHDVIIYDAIDAPVLWAEDNSDILPDARNMAIPARHVMAILECKVRLNSTKAREAVDQLGELRNFSGLHSNFSCGVVFFEVDPSAETSPAALNNLMPENPIPGFFGGVILRGNSIDPDLTCELRLMASPCERQNPICATFGISQNSGKWSSSSSVLLSSLSANAAPVVVHKGDGNPLNIAPNSPTHHYIMCTWSLNNFSRFAFELIDQLEGRRSNNCGSKDCPVITFK